MYRAAEVCKMRRKLEKKKKDLSTELLSAETLRQIELSHRRNYQQLLKADLHPNSIYGTKLPPLERMTVIQSSDTKLSQMSKPLNQYRTYDMPPLKLMCRGKQPKLIQDNVPEFRLSPPAIPFDDDNKRERSLFTPI